jgi:hypothetical protein
VQWYLLPPIDSLSAFCSRARWDAVKGEAWKYRVVMADVIWKLRIGRVNERGRSIVTWRSMAIETMGFGGWDVSEDGGVVYDQNLL